MRKFLLTSLLALAAAPLRADTTALILGNERYDTLGRVVFGDDVGAGAIALTRNGARVYSTLNADVRAARAQARDFLRDQDNVTSRIAVLSGNFVTDGPRTWFLAKNATTPSVFGPGDHAILLDTVLEVLAQTPGQAMLVLGYEPRDDDDLGGSLREGIGDLTIPQGVTVVRGGPGSVAPFVEDTLAVPGSDAMGAVASTRRLTADGYVPGTLILTPDQEAAAGPSVGPGPAEPDRQQDAEDWARAQQVDTANGYAAYLSNHPRGRYVEDARSVLEDIRSEPNRAERIAEEALGLNREARRAVQRDLTVLDYDTRGIDGIFGPGTRRAVSNWQQQNGFAQTSYLTSGQITRMDAQAERRSAEQEAEAARQRAAQEARDRAYWEETGASRNEAGLRTYLRRYPDGIYTDIAETRLAEIEEAKRARAQTQDRQAWDRARDRNTVAAFRDYLNGNENGAFRDEATTRIANLQRDNDTSAARQAAEAEERNMRLDPLTRRILEARLAQMGLEPGQVDGTFDNRTRRAIRRYQRDRGITRTGFLNQETVSRLLRGG